MCWNVGQLAQGLPPSANLHGAQCIALPSALNAFPSASPSADLTEEDEDEEDEDEQLTEEEGASDIDEGDAGGWVAAVCLNVRGRCLPVNCESINRG